MSAIYFDERELKKGNVFNISGNLCTSEGKFYEVDSWIARGGNAVVYNCLDHQSGDELAVKFLLNASFNNRKRFLLETKLLRDIEHPHISAYIGSGKITARRGKREQKIPFLVMEKADCNLQELIWSKGDKKIGSETYLSQFRGLASALAKLHETAIHRDIKPENILVLGDKWLLSDYGLCSLVAKEKEDDMTPQKGNVGPKFWLSPEAQNKRLGAGNEIGEYSDVYQIAAIFWYVIHGTHPTGTITNSDWTGPEYLRDVILKALLHNRHNRYASGQQFFDELKAAMLS